MAPSSAEHRKLAAIMFTDMVGYSALSQRNEALALDLLEEHRRIVREVLPRHAGREVKTTGDGFLIEFPSALAAVQCALAMQDTLHERSRVQPADRQVRIRIGIHVGDVVMRDGDIHGDGVNIAARIEPLAPAGGVCVSEDVARLIRNKVDRPLVVLGQAQLKNIDLPVVVYRVVMPWEHEGPPASPGVRWSGSAPRFPRSGANLASLMALALVVVGGWWVFNRGGSGPAPGKPDETVKAEAKLPSVAVVPFGGQSTDAEGAVLQTIMADALNDALRRVKGLRSVSGLVFEGRTNRLQVAKEYGIEHLLLGSVTKLGDQIRLTAELVHTTDGSRQWTERYDYDSTTENLLTLQDRMASDIAVQVAGQLSPADRAELAKSLTQSPDALKAYLQGRSSWLRGDETGFSNAIVHFEHAIALDPQYALAYAGLSDAYSAATATHLLPAIGYPKAKVAALKALQLSPNLADAHTSLGMAVMIDEWDWPKAEQCIRQAIKLEPGLAQAHDAYGIFLAAMGRFDESVREGLAAVRLNQIATSYRMNLGYAYTVQGDLTKALAQIKAAEDLDPSNSMIHLNYGWIAIVGRDYAAAERSFREAQRLGPADPLSLAGLGASLAAQGRREEATAVVQQLDELGKRRFVPAGQAAAIYAHLGETDLAMARLEQALRQKENSVPWIRVEPGLVPIRSDPRFQELVKRVFANQ